MSFEAIVIVTSDTRETVKRLSACEKRVKSSARRESVVSSPGRLVVQEQKFFSTTMPGATPYTDRVLAVKTYRNGP